MFYNIDLDDLAHIATVPPGLREQLQAEVCGTADTNTCKDWRQPV